MTKTVEEMVSEFQCPGCISGCAPCAECPSFKVEAVEKNAGWYCANHLSGTSFGTPAGVTRIYLGLPKGFNRVGMAGNPRKTHIRLWEGLPKGGSWDNLNVAVWAMEKDGFLFVRTYSPRVNVSFIDVIKGAKVEDAKGAIDVSDFLDEID